MGILGDVRKGNKGEKPENGNSSIPFTVFKIMRSYFMVEKSIVILTEKHFKERTSRGQHL